MLRPPSARLALSKAVRSCFRLEHIAAAMTVDQVTGRDRIDQEIHVDLVQSGLLD